ncbi:MAG: ATP-binding cassette domain-containing protein [Ruminococcus sp.]|nr:ATP-binding cassette domain-containing protein [Ruminococcus sp.]MBR1764740.1 ATP-binding cassette domain-containing protein [Ruminococcus sp.]
MNRIELQNISKTIKGNEVLKNISLQFESGSIYGFVGRNGSGKTMLFRMIAGLIRPTAGTVKYNGKALGAELDIIPRLGLVIENVGLYPEFTGLENLRLLAGINSLIGEEEIRAAIARMGLDPDDRRRVRKYSLGMKQRIVLAQAIMEHPDVLILDEPTNALDEEGVSMIRAVIREEKERGALVLIASHNKEDISSLCDKIYLMRSGVCTELKESEE